jgi:hypothetical protein
MNRIRHRTSGVHTLLALTLAIAGLSRNSLASTPAANAGPKHTPFVTVLLRDWDKWDTNHDGELSVAEIDRAVLDPNTQGDDAAVAGTLKLMSRSKRVTVPPLTRDYFAQYDHEAIAHPIKTNAAAAENATTDTGASGGAAPVPAVSKQLPINWDLYFVAGKNRIAKGGGPWPTNFNLDHAHQGALGDCYLIATIGSMVVHNPSEVAQLVKPMTDGGYRVTIPGAEPFVLGPLTQSQLVISSTTTGQGEWLAVIEQAVGRYNEKVKGIADDEGTDTIADGGHLDAAMSLLTGHKCTKIRLRTTIAHRQQDQSKTLPLLRKELIAAVHDNRVITASVTPPILTLPIQTPATAPTAPAAPGKPPALVLTPDMLPKIPPNINTKHAYAILGYDADTDMLEVWNPHGQYFTPKGPDGLQNGYKTNHGRFHIPLADAYTFFTSFVFEVDAPATQPAASSAAAGHPM